MTTDKSKSHSMRRTIFTILAILSAIIACGQDADQDVTKGTDCTPVEFLIIWICNKRFNFCNEFFSHISWNCTQIIWNRFVIIFCKNLLLHNTP